MNYYTECSKIQNKLLRSHKYHFLLFQPTYITEIDLLADELNTCLSTPRELRCAEYSFKVKTNPWQHPIFDDNIQRLLALLTSLRGGCGGVIYLIADDMQKVPQEVFKVYKMRLHELIGITIDSFPLPTNMVQVSLLFGTHRSWAALLLKTSYTLKYPLLDTKVIWKPATFDVDMFGEIHAKPVSDAQNQRCMELELSSVSPVQHTESSILLQSYRRENTSGQIEPETSSASVTAPAAVLKRTDDTAIPQVDFSSCQRLVWTENTKDWQKYVKIKQVKTGDIVASCPMWKPTEPMKITPDRDSLKYLFESEDDMLETMSTVRTMGPGCAVVCRTWRFHIPDCNVTEELPRGHICDILTVTDSGKLSFWVVVDTFDEDKFHDRWST